LGQIKKKIKITIKNQFTGVADGTPHPGLTPPPNFAMLRPQLKLSATAFDTGEPKQFGKNRIGAQWCKPRVTFKTQPGS